MKVIRGYWEHPGIIIDKYTEERIKIYSHPSIVKDVMNYFPTHAFVLVDDENEVINYMLISERHEPYIE